MPKPGTFTCHKFRCKGVTPVVCISRQHKRRSGGGRTGHEYPTCANAADLCSQGAAIAEKHPELIPEKARPKPKEPTGFGVGVCIHCHKPFERNRPGQRYCHQSCSNKARPDKRVALLCMWCGREFSALPSDKRKYCSRTCSAKGRVAYRKGEV